MNPLQAPLSIGLRLLSFNQCNDVLDAKRSVAPAAIANLT
jgi:hypothetical protein